MLPAVVRLRSPACAVSLLVMLGAAGSAVAQVPDGFYVFGSFQGAAGQNGIFFAHPRDPLVPVITVTGLPPALGYDPAGRRGAACVNYRRSDGALIAGERSPAGTSVDLHVMRLSGSAVVFDQLFSCGTSANVGEIAQAALLGDGRIVVAATDLAAGGPLAQFLTAQYHWEGLGIVDTVSGSVTPIAVANLNQFPGVVNGIALSPDESTVYVGNYVSVTSGDLWAVPLAGGTAVQLATFPSGPSNLAVDLDGSVLVTTLNGPPNLFRVQPIGGVVTPIATTHGPMNAIAVESVTGNYLVATATAGVPTRSLLWMTPQGQETVLLSPNLATIAGVDVNPDPETYGTGTPGTASYDWALRPNPGGLPLLGNAFFSITVTASQPQTSLALVLFGDRAAPGAQVLGLTLQVDPATAITTLLVMVDTRMTVPLGIPNIPAFLGQEVHAQSLHLDLGTQVLAATPGLVLTVL